MWQGGMTKVYDQGISVAGGMTKVYDQGISVAGV